MNLVYAFFFRNYNQLVPPACVLDEKVVCLHASVEFPDLSGCFKTHTFDLSSNEIFQAARVLVVSGCVVVQMEYVLARHFIYAKNNPVWQVLRSLKEGVT